VTLDDCEVTGNSAVFRGGGIFDLGFGSSLVASSVSGNSARDGGGIHSYSELLTLNRSTLIGNSAFGEGGAIKHSGGELRLHESTIAANYAQGNGGGIVNYGVISLWQSTITGNSTPSNGGGIFNDAGWAYVRYSTISDNSAYALGGGIYNRANVAVISSTLSANTAGFSGGGLFNSASASFVDQGATLDNSTLSGNSAARGGAITNRLGGSMAVSHSTVTGNSATIGGGILSVDGDAAQTSVDHSIVAGNEALTGSNIEGTLVDNTLNLVDIDPMLGPLADNGGLTRTHALYPGSPAIDAGDPNATAGIGDVPSWDQRGFLYSRVFDGDDVPGARIDIGAYELPNSCDFDGNQSCDVADIDALIGVITAGTDEPQYDITGDGLVNLIDRNSWLIEAGARHLPSGNAFLVGDANLDGRVDGQDFIAWNQHKFTETGKWSQGDFNADGQTDGRDYVEWNRFKFQSSDDDESRDWLRSDW
ncbi:MAG: choice-of-anchor Q domain-containing protein, partial [Planctomycetota bacterium]